MRKCPDDAAINIKGEHFPCDMMERMSEDCKDHNGWAHTNREAKAIWGPPDFRRAEMS